MKSVSEQAEVEYKDLLNHNKFLLEEKTRLETQVSCGSTKESKQNA